MVADVAYGPYFAAIATTLYFAGALARCGIYGKMRPWDAVGKARRLNKPEFPTCAVILVPLLITEPIKLFFPGKSGFRRPSSFRNPCEIQSVFLTEKNLEVTKGGAPLAIHFESGIFWAPAMEGYLQEAHIVARSIANFLPCEFRR